MFTLNCKGRLLVINHPLVMGIINLTPDSFYAPSSFDSNDELLRRAEKMINEGADIIDIGGQSSRPGAQQISVDEELTRIAGKIALVHKNFPELVISVDTYYAEVAKETVAAGASLVNDISAGNFDQQMIPVVAGLHVPYVCMHMKGRPETMQEKPHYENVTKEVLDFFIEKTQWCRKAGIHDIIIDPGLGFGKSHRHNFELLKNLSVFNMLGYPVLLGISRKSTIYKTLKITVEEALNGTTVLHTMGLMNGASIIRAHDVKEAKEAVTLFQEYSRR
jgi:dihydropteroate synthase